MPNRFSPSVVSRAPSPHALDAFLNSKAPGEGLADAIGTLGETFGAIRQSRREKEVREAIIDERAAKAGTFDADSGGFIEPQIGTPAFNPEDPEPLTERVATGTEAPTPAAEAAQQPVLPEAGRVATAGVPRASGPSAQPVIDRFLADFGNTEGLLQRREEERRLEDQLDAIGGLDARTQRLVRSGVVTPAQALKGLDDAEAEAALEVVQRQVHARAQAEDPSIGPYIPGFDYIEDFGNEREQDNKLEVERLKEEAATNRTRLTQAGALRRENIRQAGADRRARGRGGGPLGERRKAIAKQVGTPTTPEESWALDRKAEGMTDSEIIETAVLQGAQNGMTHAELSILAGNLESYLNGSAGLLDGRVKPKKSPVVNAGRGAGDFEGKEGSGAGASGSGRVRVRPGR